MLRASAEATRRPINLQGVTDVGVDSEVPGGRAILSLVDRLADGAADPSHERHGLAREVGPDAAAMVVSVAANFQMMNRVLDAVGVPVPATRTPVTEELGIDTESFGGGRRLG